MKCKTIDPRTVKGALTKNGCVNRGWLKRMMKQGRVICRQRYRMTDDYAFDAATACGEETAFRPAVYHPNGDHQSISKVMVDGLEYHPRGYGEWSLGSNCGRAYLDGCQDPENHLITFGVYSNDCQEMYVLAEPLKGFARMENALIEAIGERLNRIQRQEEARAAKFAEAA